MTNRIFTNPPRLSDKLSAQEEKFSVIGRLVRVHIWLALAISLFATIADHYGFLPEAPDKAFSDFVAARFPTVPSKQRSDIQLVLVDEQTLSSSQYLVPTDRALLASILRSIDKCEPRVVAIDLIFDRPTEPEKDQALLAALREMKSEVVIALSGASNNPASFEELLTLDGKVLVSSPTLKVDKPFFWLKDEVIRTIPDPEDIQYELFGYLVAKQLRPESRLPVNSNIDWLSHPARGSDTFRTLRVPAEAMDSTNWLPEMLCRGMAGTAVIVGAAYGFMDRHLTPLTLKSRERVAGAEIQAQITAQLVDGREVKDIPIVMRFMLSFTILTAILAVTLRFRQGFTKFVCDVAIVIATGICGVLSFWLLKYEFCSTLIVSSWSLYNFYLAAMKWKEHG